MRLLGLEITLLVRRHRTPRTLDELCESAARARADESMEELKSCVWHFERLAPLHMRSAIEYFQGRLAEVERRLGR